MSRFRTEFLRSGVPDLIREFAEPLTYYAGGTGAGRSIDGIVDRDVQVIVNDIPALATFIDVRDSDTAGISATEIDTGSDTISVPLRVGETPQVRQIVRVESTENGMVRFQVN